MVEQVDNGDAYRTTDRGLNGKAESNGSVSVSKPKVPKEDDVEDNVHVDPRNDDGLPRDRGWAWMVLLGAVLEMTIVIGIAKSSGILFVAFQEQFRSSSSTTSLISTVQNAVYSITALTVMTLLTRHISTRNLIFFGSTLNCIAYIISSQANDVRLLLLSHGILQGIATAFIQPTTITMVGQYFDKRRGLANSIAVSGGSLGSLVLAPLLTALLAQYGYRGCMLIIAGLLLNTCISAALFRSPAFYSNGNTANIKSGIYSEKILKDGQLVERDEGKVLRSPIINGLRNKHFPNGNSKSVTIGNASTDPRLLGSEPLLSGAAAHHRKRTCTESSGTVRFLRQCSHDDKHLHGSRELMAGSYMDIPGFDDNITDKDDVNTSENNSDKKRGCCSAIKALTALFDFKLFKDPVFVIMELAFGLSCSGFALASVFIIPFATEVGVDASGTATIVTIYSAIDLCSRIGIGVIADFNFVRRSTLIVICSVIVSLASFMLKFYTSYGLVIFYAVILGLFSGGYFSLFAVIIVDYMTMSKLHSCLGFTTMFHGTFVATGYIISGMLRDKTGSYVASFYYLGASILVGGLLLCCLPYVERYRDKRLKRGHELVI